MKSSLFVSIILGLSLGLVSTVGAAQQAPYEHLITDIDARFAGIFDDDNILEAAKNLFWYLATVSLVWTMGFQILRQDIGEALMELLRFMVVTGTLYWLLVNASGFAGGEGFVNRIVESFYELTNRDDTSRSFLSRGDGVAWRALHIYLKVMYETAGGEVSDRILGGLMGVLILIVLTLLAAQFLLALIMAWFLGYGGIFLLGFGGSRWTSQVAINYYKHVVALGTAILALGVIGVASDRVFANLVPTFGQRSDLTFLELGMILSVSLLMLVLGLRVPQLLYTLVTGSSLGMFAGTAGMVGSAIATGGGAALATASGRFPSGGGTSDASGAGGSMNRSGSAMDAVERSAVSAGAMTDPFHVAGGSDPFGAPRGAELKRSAGGSAFGTTGGNDASAMMRPAEQVRRSGTTSNHEGMSEPQAVSRASSEVVADSWHRATVASPSGDITPEGDAARPDYSAEMSAITAARGHDTVRADNAGSGAVNNPDVVDLGNHVDAQLEEAGQRPMSSSSSVSRQIDEASAAVSVLPVVEDDGLQEQASANALPNTRVSKSAQVASGEPVTAITMPGGGTVSTAALPEAGVQTRERGEQRAPHEIDLPGIEPVEAPSHIVSGADAGERLGAIPTANETVAASSASGTAAHASSTAVAPFDTLVPASPSSETGGHESVGGTHDRAPGSVSDAASVVVADRAISGVHSTEAVRSETMASNAGAEIPLADREEGLGESVTLATNAKTRVESSTIDHRRVSEDRAPDELVKERASSEQSEGIASTEDPETP